MDDVLDGIMSKINIVGNTAATTNADIVEMLERSSSAMSEANNSLEETIALETAAVEITQNSANVGTAYKTLAARIRGYDEETESYTLDVEELSGEIADLTKTADTPGGISLFTDDAKTEYKSTYELLKEISEVYDQLDDKTQARLLEKLAGKRQAQVIAATLNNFDAAEEAMANMEDSMGNADAEMDIIRGSMEFKMNALKETWVGIAQDLFQRDMMKGVIDGLTEFSSGIEKVVDKLGLLGTAAVGGGIAGVVAIFKNVREEITAVNAALDSMSHVSDLTGMFGGTKGLFDVSTVEAYQGALAGLSNQEAELALQTRRLSEAETQQMMSAMGRTASSEEISVLYAQQQLRAAGLEAQTQRNILKSAGFVVAEEGETNALQFCTQATLEQAIAKENLSVADEEAAMAAISMASATEEEAVAHASFADGLGSSISAMGAFIAANAGVIASVAAVAAGVTIAVGVFEYQAHAYKRAEEAAQEAQSTYDSVHETAESLREEYADLQDQINELNEAKISGDITFEQEAELSNLEAQSAELERQLQIYEQLEETAQQASVAATIALANTEESYLQKMEEDSNRFVAFFKTLANGEAWEWNQGDTTQQGQLLSNIELLQTYQDNLKLYQDRLANDPNNERYLHQQDVMNEKIADVTADIADEQSTIEGWLDVLAPDGVAIDGCEDLVKELQNALDSLAKMDMDDLNKSLYDIQSFFDGSVGSEFISDALTEAAKHGEDLQEVLDSLGLSISDIGADTNIGDLTRYFEDLARSAEKAQEEVEHVGGSVEDVSAAFEAENPNDNWNTMADLLSQAQDLYDEGLVGLEGFKSATQFITAEDLLEPVKTGNKEIDDLTFSSDVYADAWEKAVDKVNRYFDKEDPLQSAINLRDDLVSADLGEWVTSDSGDELVRWTDNFKTSADAAEAWDMSVEAAEVAMHDLEAYGAEFDEVFFSGEGLSNFESALDGIKEMYDSLDEGAEKTRLGKLIDGWEDDVDTFNSDLHELTEDQIVHIEFEYDLSALQAEIDSIQDLIYAGNNSVENYSGLIAANDAYIKTVQSGLGIDEEIQIPASITGLDEQINTLRNGLNSIEDEDVKIEAQADITNLQAVENAMYNAFADAHPEITPETDTEVVQEELDNFFSQKQKFYVEAELDEDALNTAFDFLAPNSVITFDAYVDDSLETLSALRDSEGEIHYSAVIDGVEQIVKQVTDEDGEIVYTADTSQAEEQAKEAAENTEDGEIDYNGDTSNAKAEAEEAAEDTPDGEIDYTGDASGAKAEAESAAEDAPDGEIDYTGDASEATAEAESAAEDAPDGEIDYESNVEEPDVQDYTVNADVNLDTSSAQAELESLGSEPVEVTVNADTSSAESQIQALDGEDVQVNVKADTNSTKAAISLLGGQNTNVNVQAKTAEAKTQISALGGETVQVNVNADTSSAQGAIDALEGGTVDVEVTANTSNADAAINSTSRDVPDKNFNITANSADAEGKLNSVQAYHINDKSFTISAIDNASGTLSSISSQLAAINSKTVTVTTNYVQNGSPSTKVAQGTAHASGTARAGGSWRVGSSQQALVGELGPEIVVRNGRYFTVGDYGAEIVDLLANDIVFNHKQTEAILSNGYVNERGSFWGNMAQAMGSAFGNGFNLRSSSSSSKSSSSSSSSKSSSSSSSSKSSSSSSSSKSSSSSSSSKSSSSSGSSKKSSSSSSSSSSAAESISEANEAAEEFEETIDWITIKIDRLEREIDSLDLKMSSTYRDWSSRNNALASEIDKVADEINLQQQAYDRYIQQANSVGLDESYAKLVREGAIDITTITDEDLNDKISDYQKW